MPLHICSLFRKRFDLLSGWILGPSALLASCNSIGLNPSHACCPLQSSSRRLLRSPPSSSTRAPEASKQGAVSLPVWIDHRGGRMALRGVWQLQKLVVNYCDWGGSSRGIRAFMETHLQVLREKNPHLEVVTELVRGQHPNLKGIYKNHNERVVWNMDDRVEDVIMLPDFSQWRLSFIEGFRSMP
ncbi:hypothetical protein GUJ93_ZPchr0006g43743 [Zizania palustris]|uniref:Ribosomal protein/NADH dehydrogenase domain-containing protein n=1 Tax=Zizania palustris TaxID=103762 RepID=A0A8J5T5B4_ZIZPA|nr:hypothetical protein GUJ93_ZPchr0006g43743 [Zizania palustris]